MRSTVPHRLKLRLIAAFCLLAMSGCSFRYQDLSQRQTGRTQDVTYARPAIGKYLCLSVEPGTPVALHPGGSEIIGYTRNVVAFYGVQLGKYVSVIYYNGALGWVDGLKIRPYHGPRRNSKCIVPGVDRQLRPIFVIT